MKSATVSSTFLSVLSLASAARRRIETDHMGAAPVAAASWPESDEGKWGAFMHLCGSTFEEADEFRRIMQEDGRGYEGLSMADSWASLNDSQGQPESVYLIRSVDSSGNENFPTVNQHIRDLLRNTVGIMTAINQDHRYTGSANEATAELHPWDENQIGRA
ncbi:hypothetical protein DL764_000344 [Monosporascus ibericus]|uniref:Uncharacterized protein n=1 Tax=Monosporascus ibericus TaxID=155417 RepID=A0A4Q4TVN9_9PEZI|nr:hypothetical protein DL764_000344 [Monosporascus ibericus]